MSLNIPSYSVAVQERDISARISSLMLLNFLIGVYTMVYGGTVYLYSSKKTENKNRWIILSGISLLYLLCFINSLFQSYSLILAIVVNGDTRESIFWATLDFPRWVSTLFDILFNSLFIVSDGLLLWRCYHVWRQSIRIILVPLVLLLVEIGLSIAVTVFDTKISDFNVYVSISSSLYFVSLGTTVTTTVLIGYKIHSASQLTVLRSKKLFNRIAMMVIESAAAYAIILLIYAIIIVIPSFNEAQSPMWGGGFYVQIVLIAVAGMAPTILVTRVALQDPNNTVASTSITHISGLQFRSQPTISNGSGAIENSTGRGIITSVVQTANVLDDMEFMDLKWELAQDGVHAENRV